MATITGCIVSGVQSPLTDDATDSSAADSLDKMLEKVKEEQSQDLPPVVPWLPPPPAREPERAALTLKSGDQEKPQWGVNGRRGADVDRVTWVPVRKNTPRAEGVPPQRQYTAVTSLPRQHGASLLVNTLPLRAENAHKPSTDDSRVDNPQGVPWVKPASDMFTRPPLPEAPSVPRYVKQETTVSVPPVLPAAKTENAGQSRISYAFRSWGSEHRVELTSLRRDHQPLTVLLTPSDNLVNRRLQEGVVSQPLGVSLVLHDESRGEQQRQQHDDHPSDAEDET